MKKISNYKGKLNLSKIALFGILLFACIYAAGAITITNIIATPLSSSSFSVQWTTETASNSTVFYDNTTLLNNSVSSTDNITAHSLVITGLTTNVSYYYKIKSCDNISGVCAESSTSSLMLLPEDTTTSGDVYLVLDASMKNITNTSIYTVMGRTDIDSIVTVYINKREGSTPALITLSDNTNAFSMQAGASGLFIGTVVLAPGDNIVEVHSRNGIKENFVQKSVMVDTIPPRIVLNGIPSLTAFDTINISGSVSKNSMIILLVNNESFSTIDNISGVFNFSEVQLANVAAESEADVTVQAVAKDIAGNEGATPVYNIKIDKKKPTITFTTDFSQTTHFTLFTVSGKTKPGAAVTVKNIGNFTNIEEYNGVGQQQLIQIDPLGLFFNDVTTTADSNGDFSAAVNLFSGRNTIHVVASDDAGNTFSIDKDIILELSSSDWKISKTEQYPNNIYFEDIHSNSIPVTALLQIDWIGGGSSPSLAAVSDIIKDGNKDNNQLVQEPQVLKQWWDSKNSVIYALVSINVNQWSGNANSLFDVLQNVDVMGVSIPHADFEKEMILDFKVNVQATFPAAGNTPSQNGATQTVYTKVGYAIQKPEDLSKWLSPEDINKTINNILNPSIDFLEKAQKYLLYTTGIGLTSCGVMSFANIISPAALDPKTVYWVCDRVMCPSVPPQSPVGEQTIQIGSDFKNINIIKDEDSTSIQFIDLSTLDPSQRSIYVTCPSGYPFLMITNIGKKSSQGIGAVTFNQQEQKVECIRQDTYDQLKSVYYADGPKEYSLQDTQKLYEDNRNEYLNSDGTSQLTNLNIIGAGRYYTPGAPYYDETRCLFSGPRANSWMNPRDDMIDSFRCGCLPGMYGYTKSVLQIAQGIKKCLLQAQSGEVSGGFCERIFLQYGCDVASGTFSYIMGLDNSGDQAKTADPDSRTIPVVGMIDDAKNFKKSMESRYGGSILSQSGISNEKLVNNFCLYAFTGDLSLMEGQVSGLIQAKPVAPWGLVQGTSRQAGYDPFVGQMKINYNIYLYVVPGGITSVELKLVCDPSGEDGQYCPAKSEEQIITQGIPREITADQSIDTKITFQAAPARYWYNKAVLTLLYRLDLGGELKIQTFTGKITHSGELSNGCTFTLDGGISCTPINIDEGGVVQLISQGSSVNDKDYTRISPAVPFFFSNNRISLLAKIFNDYNQDFYVTVDIKSPAAATGRTNTNKKWQYLIHPSGKPQGEMQYYNLRLGEIGKEGAQETQSNTIAITQPVYAVTSSASDEAITVKNPKDSNICGIKSTVNERTAILDKKELDSITTDITRYTANAKDEYFVDITNGRVYFVISTEVKDVLNIVPETSENSNIINTALLGVNFTYPEGTLKLINTLEKECNTPNGGGVTQVVATNDKQSYMLYLFDKDGKFISATWITKASEISSVTPGTYNVDINILKDSSGGGYADTEVPYDAKSQKMSMTWTVQQQPLQNTCTGNPVMEILEPLGDYISTPTESSSTFFGANILDDCNQLSYVKASLVKASNGEELCSCKVSQASNDAYNYGIGDGIVQACTPTDSCGIIYVDGPTKTPSTDSQFTPYYSFKLSMDDTLISKLQNTDYKVVFESADKRGESTKATKEKTIRFNDQIDPSENTLKETPTRVELPITVAINTVTAKKCSDLQGTCSSPSSGCTTGYVYQTGTYSECQSGYGCCVKSS